MKVILSWLREFCPTDLSAEELAEQLSVQGVHVEEIARPWERLQEVVVVRVLEVRDHPRSEKLCLARVDTGREEREVVVGVRNMVAGDLVAYAGPGATLPVLEEPLSPREVRGVRSEGMLCSPFELGISPDHDRILVLPPDAPVGAAFREHFGLDIEVLDIEVEPNRSDLMSVIGVAREAAAATGAPFLVPEWEIAEDDEKAADAATVEVLDLDRCPHYLARVIRGVSVGHAPIQAQARLFASGMRPLSNVVDATNYVMLEMGQPLHPFDLALLESSGVVVRTAEEGERLVTLDGVERELSAQDLVIADHTRAVAIAGVMGSDAAEVSPGTVDVLLESAHFWRTGILRTGRRLGLLTEASIRFERGADPEAVGRAAERAAQLIVAWSEGRILAGAVEEGSPPDRGRVTVRASRASLILGREVAAKEIRDALGAFRIEAEEVDDVVVAEVPGHRPDLESEIDLIEEVARANRGYERLGSTLPGIRQSGGLAPTYAFRRRVRRGLVAADLRETLSLSFASDSDLELMDHADGVRMAKPPVADQPFLRTSLLPGLFRALQRNAYRQAGGAAVFEIGHVFRPGEPVDEREMVAVALHGAPGTGYPEELREVDFFDAKGCVEALLGVLGIDEWALGNPLVRPFHPTRSAVVSVGGETAGVLGELSPRVAAQLDLTGRVAVAELDVDVLARHAATGVAYEEVPRFPPVRRDLAFVVDAEAPAGPVRAALLEAGGDLVGAAVLFDVFQGEPLEPGKKNLAFAVDFRAPDRTLTDEEVEPVVRAIAGRLARDFGAELRTG